MKNRKLNQNLTVVIAAFIFAVILYSGSRILRSNPESINTAELLNAQTSCNTSFFSIISPAGWNFTKSCLQNNLQIYSTDSRFLFFQPSTELNNAVTIKTPNSEIKDNTNLNWSINVTSSAKLIVMPRHIPGLTAPAWIRNGYTRQTTDDLSQIAQFSKRKNDQGLIGLYDIYTRNIGPGTVILQGASDATTPAYSMYLVALIPGTITTPTATPTPSPTPSRSPSPTPTANPSLPPANLLAIASQHVNPPADCWTVYRASDGWHLYNISPYFSVVVNGKTIKQHPGSDADLAWACGKDMTDVFNKGAKTAGVSGHGDKAHLSHSSATNKLKELRVPGY